MNNLISKLPIGSSANTMTTHGKFIQSDNTTSVCSELVELKYIITVHGKPVELQRLIYHSLQHAPSERRVSVGLRQIQTKWHADSANIQLEQYHRDTHNTKWQCRQNIEQFRNKAIRLYPQSEELNK